MVTHGFSGKHILSLSILLLLTVSVVGSAWEFQTVGSGHTVGDDTLDFTSSGVAVCLYSDADSDLRLAYIVGTSVHTDVIESSFSGEASMAVGATDDVHIVYYHQNEVIYARYDLGSGALVKETISRSLLTSGTNQGFCEYLGHPEIALDSADRPHIQVAYRAGDCHMNYTKTYISSVYPSGGTWVLELDSRAMCEFGTYRGSSYIIGQDGAKHILYRGRTGHGLPLFWYLYSPSEQSTEWNCSTYGSESGSEGLDATLKDNALYISVDGKIIKQDGPHSMTFHELHDVTASSGSITHSEDYLYREHVVSMNLFIGSDEGGGWNEEIAFGQVEEAYKRTIHYHDGLNILYTTKDDQGNLVVKFSYMPKAIPEKTSVLPVPYFSQGTTQWCFLNTVAMVLQYYGEKKHSWDLAEYFHIPHGFYYPYTDWLNADDLNDYFSDAGINLVASDKRYGSLSDPNLSFEDDIKPYIDAGTPVIFMMGTTGQHSVAIVGYSASAVLTSILIHDPSGKYFSDTDNMFINISWQEFVDELPYPIQLYYLSGGSSSEPAVAMWVIDEDVKHCIDEDPWDCRDPLEVESSNYLDFGLQYRTNWHSYPPGFFFWPIPHPFSSILRWNPSSGSQSLHILTNISNTRDEDIPEAFIEATIVNAETGEEQTFNSQTFNVASFTLNKNAWSITQNPSTFSVPLSKIGSGTFDLYLSLKAQIGDDTERLDRIGPMRFSVATSLDLIGIASASPVDLQLTDPEGYVINKQESQITGAAYTEVDINGDGDPDDIILIPNRKLGTYVINVIPEPGASPNDTFTLQVCIGGDCLLIAENVRIADIPDEPYRIEVTEEGIELVGGTCSPSQFINFGPNPIPPQGCIFWLNLPDDTVSATLKIFDIDGALLVSTPLDPTADRYPGTGRWTPQDGLGRLIGTGLYLYLVEIEHADGTVTYSPVQKMVIQR